MAEAKFTTHELDDSTNLEKAVHPKQEHDPSVADQQEELEEEAQSGVKTVEAITLSWSSTWLIVIYAW